MTVVCKSHLIRFGVSNSKNFGCVFNQDLKILEKSYY